MSRWWLPLVILSVGCGVEFNSDGGRAGGGAGASAAGGAPSTTSSGGATSSDGAGGPGGGLGGSGSAGGAGGAGGSEPLCEESPCKIMPPQCGCDASEKCVYDESWLPTCTAVSETPSDEGSLCSEESDCSAGTTCKGYWGGQTKCLAYCESDDDCTQGPGSKCIWKNDQTQSTICTTNCNPLNSSGCAIGEKCSFVWDSLDPSHVGTTCSGEGSTQEGFACAQQFDCAAGLLCVNGNCRKICQSSAQCPAGKSCYPISPAIVIDGKSYGACI